MAHHATRNHLHARGDEGTKLEVLEPKNGAAKGYSPDFGQLGQMHINVDDHGEERFRRVGGALLLQRGSNSV
jgi:hypothetical protein